MRESRPNFDNELLCRLFLQTTKIHELQDQDLATSIEMVRATASLKNLSEAIAVLKASGIVAIDQESIPVLINRLSEGMKNEQP